MQEVLKGEIHIFPKIWIIYAASKIETVLNSRTQTFRLPLAQYALLFASDWLAARLASPPQLLLGIFNASAPT